MKIISHRGFLKGPDSKIENSPQFIDKAISLELDVEIDLWLICDELFLGHDNPKYKVDIDWLLNRKNNLWIHCKNIKAIDYLLMRKYSLNFFFHQLDDVTLTSKGFLWVYPEKEYTSNSVIVSLDQNSAIDILKSELKPYGVCTDYPRSLK